MNTKTLYGRKYIYRNKTNPALKEESDSPFSEEKLKDWKLVGMSSNRMLAGEKLLKK